MAPDTLRVGLVLAAVGDLSGSGGTERQFSDLFDFLWRRRDSRVSLITSAIAVRRLHDAGRLEATTGIIALPLGDAPARTKAGIAWLTLTLLWSTLGRGFDILHICQPTPAYLPFVALITRLPRSWRPRVTMTVVDCTLAPNLIAAAPVDDLYERQVIDAHRLYAKWTRLDGVFSWYRLFVEVAGRIAMFGNATITAAKYCFTSVERFQPATKIPLVVYAGRLSAQKRPLLFVDAIASLLQRHATLASRYRFAMYGSGPLEAATRERIAAHGLSGRIELTSTPDMAPVFAQSQLFVSTQAYENFTSLAMMEAMASGNAIVAERVGQSGEFVTPENGYLVSPASPDAFADAIADYFSHPERHDHMAAESRRLATEVHTIEHFSSDIAGFWRAVASA